MSHQVNIHLRHHPIAPDEIALEPATRNINLNPVHKVLKIGRASKSLNKGLQGALDNGWFDSPVMSRNHAELIYRPSENVVQIRDVGSMHGTFVNGEKLFDESKALNLNDEIVFGVDVRRGMETFPACHFEVTFEVLPWKKPNSYAVPDSSSDEGEGYNFSDEDKSENASSQNDTSIEMTHSSPAASKSIEAIDLTLNDTPSPRLGPAETICNSTVKKTQEQKFSPRPTTPLSPVTNLKQQEPASQSPLFSSSAPLSPVLSARGKRPLSNIILSAIAKNYTSRHRISNRHYDSDDDQEMLSSPYESDDSDLEDPSNSQNASDDDEEDEDSEVSESSESSEVSSFVVLDEIPSSVLSSAGSSANSSRAPSPIPQAFYNGRPLFENADIPESHVRTQIDTSKEVLDLGEHGIDGDDDEDDASVGLSEAANEGLETLVKDGLLENKPASPSFRFGGPPSGWSRHPPFQSHKFESNVNFLTPLAPISRSISSFDREASPSVVAMFKGTESSDMMETCNDQWNVSSAKKSYSKALGDRTGKHAFFAAREENKMQFQARVDEDDSDENHHQPSTLSPITRPSRVRFSQPLAHFVQPVEPIKYHGNGFDHGFRIQDHLISRNEINRQNVTSPAYSIGSAEEERIIHPFYFSSDASSRAQESPVIERFPGRSGLRIDDIIDNSATKKSSKRKADEISGDDGINSLFEEDVRDWASSVEVSGNCTRSPNASSEVVHEQSAIKVVPSTLGSANIEARPIKRLKIKKLVEAVGYFALGGAAVGAGLFSALVATAPDFL